MTEYSFQHSTWWCDESAICAWSGRVHQAKSGHTGARSNTVFQNYSFTIRSEDFHLFLSAFSSQQHIQGECWILPWRKCASITYWQTWSTDRNTTWSQHEAGRRHLKNARPRFCCELFLVNLMYNTWGNLNNSVVWFSISSLSYQAQNVWCITVITIFLHLCAQITSRGLAVSFNLLEKQSTDPPDVPSLQQAITNLQNLISSDSLLVHIYSLQGFMCIEPSRVCFPP